MLFTWVVDYADSAVFDHHSTTRHSAVAIIKTAQSLLPARDDLYVLTPDNTLIKHWTTLLSNVA